MIISLKSKLISLILLTTATQVVCGEQPTSTLSLTVRQSESTEIKQKHSITTTLLSGITGIGLGALTGSLCATMDRHAPTRFLIPLTWICTGVAEMQLRNGIDQSATQYKVPFNKRAAYLSSKVASWITWLYMMGHIG